MLFLLLAAQLANAGARPVPIRTEPVELPAKPGIDLRPVDIWRFDWVEERLFRVENSKMIFDTKVTRDENGFRTIPDSKNKKNLRYHLFIGGCSFTFGEGLEDPDTFPAMVSTHLPQTRVVNTGAQGTGISEQLYLWKSFNWNERYKEQEGLMLYSMIDDHFERLSRTWRYLDWAREATPYYKQQDGKLVYAGVIGETPGYQWAQFVRKMGMSEWWLRGASHFAPLILKDSVSTMMLHLQELKAAYLEQFPKGKFVVIWRPFVPPWTVEERREEILAALKKANIDYWDYPIDWKYHESTGGRDARIIIGDGHANAFSNREYTNHLVQKIKSTTSQPTL